MDLKEFYKQEIQVYSAQHARLQKQENRLSFIRLTIFLGSLLCFYLLFSVSVLLAILLLGFGLFMLGWTIRYQSDITRKKEQVGHLVNINTLELKSLDGDFSAYGSGGEFLDKGHPYSYDLDIFGSSSLFQFLNRTISYPAAELMANWLKGPANPDEIRERQQAILELKNMTAWRQQLQSLGYIYKEAANHPQAVLDWLTSPLVFLGNKLLRILLPLLSLAILGSMALWMMGYSSAYLVILIFVNMGVYYKHMKPINRMHQQVSKSYEMLQSYGEAIRLIESQEFKAAKIGALKQKLHGELKASHLLQKLARLVNRLDIRLNLMISMPLNVFFFWDLHYCIALEKWKVRYSAFVKNWVSIMAEMEVLSCFSNASFNNPTWVMPILEPGYFVLNASQMGHPLIPVAKRINNDFTIRGEGKIVLVTGSNMSGKSTFQRTCGINMVLAFAGSVVCADTFLVTPVDLLTSMRITDSLEDNTSSFYAELKRLAMIIRESERKQQVFLLLDEILRGTNSSDRHIGSKALILQLIQQKVCGIVATHDLTLADLQAENPQAVDNYNFDVKISGEELYFDYKLNSGICKSLNASILMKKMGIRI